jgi:phage-related protein
LATPIQFFGQIGILMAEVAGRAGVLTDRFSAMTGISINLGGVLNFVTGALQGFTVSGLMSLPMISTFVGTLQVLNGVLSALPGVLSAVGGAFSALGSAVSGVADKVGGLLGSLGRVATAIGNLPSVNINIPGFQHGGFALPGQVFKVGEGGPETGYALPGGGVMIVPDGGHRAGASSSITVNVNGATMGPVSETQIVNAIRRYQLLYG